MKKLMFLIVFVLAVCFQNVQAQHETGLGLRLGYFNGMTAKHFFEPGRALEGLLSFRWDGFVVTGLVEWQKPIVEVENLEWFIGVGAHVGYWGEGKYHWETYRSHTILGADFIIGLEYTFQEIPLSLSLDWKPAVNLLSPVHWWGDGVALSFRYLFR